MFAKESFHKKRDVYFNISFNNKTPPLDRKDKTIYTKKRDAYFSISFFDP